MNANTNTKTPITKLPVYRCDQQKHILNLADYIERLNGRPVWRGLQLAQQQESLQQQEPLQQPPQQQESAQQQEPMHQQESAQQQEPPPQHEHDGENINPQVEQNKSRGKRKLKQQKLQQHYDEK